MTTSTYNELFSFFGLQQNPFGVSPDVRFFFSTPACESALAELLFAIQTRQGLTLLTGEAGAGKTTLLQQLLEALRRRSVSSSYIFHSRLDADDLFRFILQDFGVECASRRKGDIIQTLQDWLVGRHAAGDTPVIIIDEAHVLPSETIDELRLLLNLESSGGKLVQILLAGQPELDEKLRRPELRQLRQRVMFRCRLPLLTREETSGYIRSRLTSAGMENPELFPAPAVDAIYEYSKGIPRAINLLGEHAIINAYAEHQRAVTPDSIRSIAADFDLVENPISLSPDPARSVRTPRFPLLDPEPRSLSGLRMAYLSELPLHGNNSPAPEERPGLMLEQLVSFAELPAAPAKPVAAVSEPKKSPETVPAPAALPFPTAIAGPVETKLPAPVYTRVDASWERVSGSLVTPAVFRHGHVVRRRHRHNAFLSYWKRHSDFLSYWKEVGNSFRRDAHALRSDWTSLLRRARAKRPDPLED